MGNQMLHHGNIAFFRLLREHPCRLVDQHDLLIFIENIQLCPGMYGSFFLFPESFDRLFGEKQFHCISLFQFFISCCFFTVQRDVFLSHHLIEKAFRCQFHIFCEKFIKTLPCLVL